MSNASIKEARVIAGALESHLKGSEICDLLLKAANSLRLLASENEDLRNEVDLLSDQIIEMQS